MQREVCIILIYYELKHGFCKFNCRGVVHLGGPVSRYYQVVLPRWGLESSVLFTIVLISYKIKANCWRSKWCVQMVVYGIDYKKYLIWLYLASFLKQLGRVLIQRTSHPSIGYHQDSRVSIYANPCFQASNLLYKKVFCLSEHSLIAKKKQ